MRILQFTLVNANNQSPSASVHSPSNRLRSGAGCATLGRGSSIRCSTGEVGIDMPTCSPEKAQFRCLTLGRKMSMNATPQFYSHHLHHPMPDTSASGTIRNGQLSSSTNELPLIIPMPRQVKQKPPSSVTVNVPILNSILTSSSSSTGHSNNPNSSFANSNNNGSSNAASGTGTLKKRVQIQEVTV